MAIPSWIDPPFVIAILGVLGTIIAAFIPGWMAAVEERKRRAQKPRFDPSEVREPGQSEPRQWNLIDPDVDHGIFYRAGAEDADVLLVLIHGLLGDAATTWQRLPDLLLEAVRPRFDIFSFGYPAKALHRASLKEATRDLLSALRGRFATYPHLIFVTHSAGGIVLKDAMCDAMQRSLDLLSDRMRLRFEPLRTISLRTRMIFNIAVPHSGGSVAGTMTLIPLFLLVSPLLFLFGKLLAAAEAVGLRKGRRGFAYGFNRIPWQVRYRAPRLLTAEKTYRALIAECDRGRVPRPLSNEINGTHDSTILRPRDDVHDFNSQASRQTSALDSSRLIFRGTHPSVKHAKSVNDALVSLIATGLQRYADEADTILSSHTLFRSVELDGGKPLIGAEKMQEVETVEWAAAGATTGTQQV